MVAWRLSNSWKVVLGRCYAIMFNKVVLLNKLFSIVICMTTNKEEDEHFDEVSKNPTSSKDVHKSGPFQFSSKDIEESLRPFTGEVYG